MLKPHSHFLPKVLAKCRGEKGEVEGSHGLGGVGRDKRGADLMPVLASKLADMC